MRAPGKYENRAMLGAANAVANRITVQDEVLQINTEDLRDIKVQLVQVTDGGTATLLVQYTLDGTYWFTLASKADSDFAAAAGATLQIPVSNGATVPMPLAVKAVRVKASALSGAGPFLATVTGLQGASA